MRRTRLSAEFVRGKIRSIVRNPQVAELLTPTDHPLGAKRICVDTDYYNTYNRDNVTLVDLRKAPIVEITETVDCAPRTRTTSSTAWSMRPASTR
jgi:cyclohexanone monooxygenase